MKRTVFFLLLCFGLLAGLAFAQDTPESEPEVASVSLYREIGQRRPQGIQYDANFDRFAMVDLQGRLLLVDAATYTTQHTLHPRGNYNAYTFSEDGRYLALAIDRRVELWDANEGALVATLEPAGALSVIGPLFFSPDNDLLLINTVVPAPPELRRSENDTSNLPWLWDLRDARDEANSSLPNRAEAHPFYDFRYGMALGANRRLIGGYPSRLTLLEAQERSIPIVSEIPANRQERDPLYIWRSATDPFLYIDPRTSGEFVQVDTRTSETHLLPVGRSLYYETIDSAKDFQHSSIARTIGTPNSQRTNSLLRLLYSDGVMHYRDFAPTTLMLLDILLPMTVTSDQVGLLVYLYNENVATGTLEILRPPDVQKLALHPDGSRLMVRRASGLQPVEIYDIETGVLELTIFPAEPDGIGSQILAYSADGRTIISDFQRFDAETGELIAGVPGYTTGFDQFFFTEDSRSLVTITGPDWRLWDIETGELRLRRQFQPRGNILRRSDDGIYYLTETPTNEGTLLEFYDVYADSRRAVLIPDVSGMGVRGIIPDADWRTFIVTYNGTQGEDLAVFDDTGKQRMFMHSQDLLPNAADFGWLDDQTVYVIGSRSLPEPRAYGLDYHKSGIPTCLVESFPNAWPQWVELWDSLNYRLDRQQFASLTERLCAKPPAEAEQLVPALTPTPRSIYRADATLVPPGLPGVPSCLTQRFPGQQLDYAELWREMSEPLNDAEKAEFETLLCEGLISSLAHIQPTATVNPNLLYAATPTPDGFAPETVDSGDRGQGVMTIDIHTGNRQFGSYLPPTPEPEKQPRSLSLVADQFVSVFGFRPYDFALSRDGQLVAMRDEYGFVDIYRLGTPYEALAALATATYAVEGASQGIGRTIGLPSTPTPAFGFVGQPSPTWTPTITPTAPAPPEGDVSSEATVEDICPVRRLYDISAPPADYAATGRVLVFPVGDDYYRTAVVKPESGGLYIDDTLPRCGFDENCRLSFDRQWILRIEDQITVSRADGSEERVLFTAAERPVWPRDFSWRGLHTLEWAYQGYLPEKYRDAVTLYRRYDPVTGGLSEPFEAVRGVQVHELPTSLVSLQPVEENLMLLSTPYTNAHGGRGSRYYLYDRGAQTYNYFIRIDDGSLNYEWHPLGAALYYQRPGREGWYVYDPETKTHAYYGAQFLQGFWSPDGRYTASMFQQRGREIERRLAAGELPLKLRVWDSQTNTLRRYCIPETGSIHYDSELFWSPDSRYLLFTIRLPEGGDSFPTPVGPETPVPVPTAVPLEIQYDLRFTRLVVLDTETGFITVISKEVNNVIVWTQEEGQ
jgi:WD40 repeat protein